MKEYKIRARRFTVETNTSKGLEGKFPGRIGDLVRLQLYSAGRFESDRPGASSLDSIIGYVMECTLKTVTLSHQNPKNGFSGYHKRFSFFQFGRGDRTYLLEDFGKCEIIQKIINDFLGEEIK